MRKMIYVGSLVLAMGLLVLSCGKDDGPDTPQVPAPNITGHNGSGAVGAPLIVNGSSFGTSISDNTVTLNGTAVTLSEANANKLTGTVPVGATTGKIKVTTAGGTDTSEDDFEVTTGGTNAIILDKTSLELFSLDTLDLPEITNIGDFENQEADWDSNNENVLSITEEGSIVAHKSGLAELTVTIGNHVATCSVIVNPSILVAGVENINGIDRAAFWKNGEVNYLSEGLSAAEAIAVDDGGNIYVTGFKRNEQDISVATLWINGEPHFLEDGLSISYANSIYIDTAENSNNIYVVGYKVTDDMEGYATAMLWEYGASPIEIPNNESMEEAKSVTADENGTIIVVGVESKDAKSKARLWKIPGNGIVLSEESADEAYARDVIIDNKGEIMVVGSNRAGEFNSAKLWQVGGETTNIEGGDGSNATAYSVFPKDNKLYAVGYEKGGNYYDATLWEIENGQTQSTTDLTDNVSLAPHEAKSIFILENMAYVVGYRTFNGEKAMLWTIDLENGKSIDYQYLDSSNSAYSYANSVYVR
ncbi:IPT/TIG domain-containing protein [Flagellimonas flava]|uniref:IPT/TIG domain-containing protein n=1 Tax=Flagellimonas flava TaxID=570519 RepID=A0A1M5L2W2_9FLAO|nr:IPT/TIG domain-containing protein [Allomuricauda flava]SHG59434.1 hypothetical protein SAMN04488116_1933 [Allomuricauda flava]